MPASVAKTILIGLLLCHGVTSVWAQLRQAPPAQPRPGPGAVLSSNDPRAIQGEAFRLVGVNPDSAKALAEHVMLLFRNQGQINQVVRTQEIVGHAYMAMGRLDSALAVFERCRDQNIVLRDTVQLASALHLIGVAHDQRGSLAAALENFLASYELKKKLANPRDQIMTLNHVGVIYHKLRDYALAEHYFTEMLGIAESLDSVRDIAGALNNLGLVHSDRGDLHKAVDGYRRSLGVVSRIGAPDIAASNHNNLGRTFLRLGLADSALAHFRKADVLGERLNSPIHAYTTEMGFADAYVTLRQPDVALGHALQALEKAKAIGTPLEQREVYGLLSRLYESTGDFAAAFEAQKQFKRFADSLAADDQRAAIDRLATQFEFDRQKQVLSAAQEARELVLQQRIHLQRIFTGIVLVLFLVAAYVSVIAIRRNAEKREINRLLQQSNREIMLQKEQLERQTEQLNETNRLKDRLLSIMSHDLRGPLASMSSVLEMVKAGMLTEEEMQHLFRELESMADNNTRLLDNLLIWARRQWKGDDAFEPGRLVLQPLVADKLTQLAGVAKAKGVLLRNRVPDGLEIHADVGTMEVVIHNLVTNAIKFSSEGDVVTVAGRQLGDRVELWVSDEGVGIAPKNLSRLFSVDTFTTAGTHNETGTGLGLLICHDFVKANGGSIAVESELGAGTTFTITLPAYVESTAQPVEV